MIVASLIMIAVSRGHVSAYPPFIEACLWEGAGAGSGRILGSISTVCIIDWKLAFLFIFPCVHSAWKNNTPCISDQARPTPHPSPLSLFFLRSILFDNLKCVICMKLLN